LSCSANTRSARKLHTCDSFVIASLASLPPDATRYSNTCLILGDGTATFSPMSDSKDTSVAGAGSRLHSVDSSLTERQRTILNVIRESVTTRGYPPSIREIGDAVGLTSTSSVAHQLRTLE